MSGIAGILRRDGGLVPEKWGDLLEQSLLLGGSSTFRFEDSIPVEHGNLHILLLSGSGPIGTDPSGSMVVDGDFEGECEFARWNEETLELELGRKGTGQKSLYWFDLADAGDGLMFCSNPLPLLKIANGLELPHGDFSNGVMEYLQHGFVIEGGELLSPICSMPLQKNSSPSRSMTSTLNCDFTTTVAEDVQTLVRILGTPFADPTLLSTLQQYRYSKEIGRDVVDGLVIPKSARFLERFFPSKQDEKQMQFQRSKAKRIELGAIAGYVGVELSVAPEQERIEPILFPLSSWLRSPQSSFGQLASDTFHSDSAFCGLPIEKSDVLKIFAAHQDESHDYATDLFALLTLELWHQLVRA